MSLDTTFVAVIAALVPTIVTALVGWSFRTIFEDVRTGLRSIESEMKELRSELGDHREEFSGLKARVEALERDRDNRRRRG